MPDAITGKAGMSHRIPAITDAAVCGVNTVSS